MRVGKRQYSNKLCCAVDYQDWDACCQKRKILPLLPLLLCKKIWRNRHKCTGPSDLFGSLGHSVFKHLYNLSKIEFNGVSFFCFSSPKTTWVSACFSLFGNSYFPSCNNFSKISSYILIPNFIISKSSINLSQYAQLSHINLDSSHFIEHYKATFSRKRIVLICFVLDFMR